MLGLIKRLHTAGVVGINRRNANYTLLYNQRHLYPLVDDKLQTKKLAQEAGITVPELYAVVEIERQIKTLPSILHRHSDFVVKPAMGSGGDGIIVITGRMKSDFVKISGNLLNWEALAYHLSNTLSGMYSLGGHPDKAIIEYRVKPDPVFSAISFEGVPDIRIIVFLGVPVMAMVRLPTRLSDGKANLHQGAIGAGVDIASGKTLTAVWKNHIVEEHPDTGNPVTGVLIPGWERLLELAARCYDLVDLGYFGVDFVLDRQLGPMILEINARPGLNIRDWNR
jgi:alpha-L-glutamate ligase-like protein